ncbi:unnamed protein product [Effrenium voratum]|nr:unnamed protein product [Effrenium voratum]
MYEEFLRTKKTAKRTVKEEGEEEEGGSAEAEEAKEAFRDTRSELTHRIVEGLRGDAFLVARDLGLDALSEPQGIENLIKQMRDMVFPRATEEARELFRVGQKPQGALSRQRGESMISYISRRRRWWRTLVEMDPTLSLSEQMRSELMLELANISHQEILVIRACSEGGRELSKVEEALIRNYGGVHLREGRVLGPSSTGKGGYQTKGKGKSSFHSSSSSSGSGYWRRSALPAWSGYPEWEEGEPMNPHEEAEDEGFGYTVVPDYGEFEEIGDEGEATALNAMEELDAESSDPLSVGEAIQLQLAANAAFGVEGTATGPVTLIANFRAQKGKGEMDEDLEGGEQRMLLGKYKGEELAAADLHIILQDCVVEVTQGGEPASPPWEAGTYRYNRVPELVCDTGTVVFSVGLRWDFANHEMMKMERDHDVVMEILPENRRSLPTVMLDCRGIHDPDCGATLFGAMLCRMAEDNWRIVHYHSDSWRRMDCGGHCEMCNMTEANANNLIEMVESSFPKEQRNAPKPAAPRVSTPKPMLMKIQSKAKPQSVAKENPVKVPAVEEKNQEMEQLKAEVSRLAGMVKGLVEERDKARTLELGSAPWREFDSRESRKRKASSPETARDDSARSARGDTDFIGDVDPDRCGPGDFSARSTRPFEMSLQYNQRAQLQLTPKYWLQKFVENVTHDHEGWIGPYEIDQSKKEKPVKEMNYEMNIKYYLRVRGYGQSFRMPQEFIKRGWRKTVFARPKGGDHDEWRLLVQDVPAKMRVDYPKDSIAVDAHRADLVAIKKELDKGLDLGVPGLPEREGT